MTDIIQQNTRERITSDDINDRQDIVSRQLAEYLRNACGFRIGFSGLTIESDRNVVFGGYDMTQSGTDLVFSAGAIGVLNATLPAVPRTYESDYRYLLNTDPTTLSIVGVPDGWALVLVTPEQADTLVASRDIWDPGAGAFVSTPGQVKTRVQRAAFSLISTGTATNIPTWLSTQNVIWAGLFSGGNLVAKVDYRNLMDTLASADDCGEVGRVERRGLRMKSRTAVRFDLAANLFGVRVSNVSLADTTLQAYAENGLTIGNSTTYYLYLGLHQAGGLRAVAPRGAYTDTVGRGYMVVSTTAPDPDTLLNPSDITPQAPFATHVIPDGYAICVGAVRTGASAAAEVQECSQSGLHRVATGSSLNGPYGILLSSGSAAADLTGTGGGPIGIRFVRMRISSSAGSTDTFTTVNLRDTVTTDTVAWFSFAADHDDIISDVEIPYSKGRSFERASGTWANNTYCQLQSYQW